MTRRFVRLSLAALLLSAFAAPASATKYAGEFMKIPVGARLIKGGSSFWSSFGSWRLSGPNWLPWRMCRGLPTFPYGKSS